MKKLTIFIISLFIFIVFIGCNGNTSTTTDTFVPTCGLEDCFTTTVAPTTQTPTTTQAPTTTHTPTTIAPTTIVPTTITTTEVPTTEITTNYLESIVDSLVIEDFITENFYLPAELDAVTVSWSTLNIEFLDIAAEVMSHEDKFVYLVKVTKPEYSLGDQTVVLTGIFEYYNEEIIRDYNLTIEKIPAEAYIQSDLNLIGSSYIIEDDWTFPTLEYSNYQNIIISMELTEYLVYADETFIVTRPSEDTTGTITFDLVYGDQEQEVVISLTIKKEITVIEGATLFISQYIEGSSFNKYIEIYNPTTETVNLSEYALEIYFNGSTSSGGTLTLSGTLNSGAVIVIGHPSGTLYTPDLTNGTAINYNGNDVLVLKHNGVIIDSIGQIGSTADFAINVTLIRKTGIYSGDINPNDVFTLDEWNSYPTDTVTDLGSHTT